MEESAEMEIDNVVFDNDDIIRWRIEEMYDHSRVNLSFLAGLSGNDGGTQFWDYNKLEFELDYAGEDREMELRLFGDAIQSLEAESSNQSDTSLSIEADANTSDGIVSKDIPKGTLANSPPSNTVAVRLYHSSPVPPEPPPPRGRGKSKEVMEKYYGPMKVDHMKRLARAEKRNCQPYSVSDLEGTDYDSDVGPPLRERARSTTRNRRAIDSDDEDVVEIAPPKKRVRRIAKKAPKARKAPKGNAIDDKEEDEDMEDEIIPSDDDDESWAPNMKERKRNKNRDKKRLAAGKPRPTTFRIRNQVLAVPSIEPKKKSLVSKTKEKKSKPQRKSFFEQTVENAVRSGRKSKEFWDATQTTVRRALRRPFYAFPEGQRGLNIPSVDQTELYLDSTDWDSEDDDNEPPLDSIFIEDSRLGSGRSGWIPSLNKVVAFIPKDEKPEDPLLLIQFRLQHGLFDGNLETIPNREKECARRWRILEALKNKGFFDNLRIFDVLPPSE